MSEKDQQLKSLRLIQNEYAEIKGKQLLQSIIALNKGEKHS